MLSVSSLNIISSHETSFSSLARGSSRCWESRERLYLLPHTPLLPASRRDKAQAPPARAAPALGPGSSSAERLGLGLQPRGGRWPRAGAWGSAGVLPKGNLVNEKPSPTPPSHRGFFPGWRGGGRAWQAAQPRPSPRGKVFRGLPISHLAPRVCRDGQEQRDAPWGNTDSSHWHQGHNLGQRGGAGQPLPLLQKPNTNSARVWLSVELVARIKWLLLNLL